MFNTGLNSMPTSTLYTLKYYCVEVYCSVMSVFNLSVLELNFNTWHLNIFKFRTQTVRHFLVSHSYIYYYIHISIYKFGLSVCLSVCLHPINVKITEPIKPNFFVRPTSRKVYGPRNYCKESYFRGVRILCTALYCLWAVM